MIRIGDGIPSVTLKRMGADGIETIDAAALFAGRRIALFAVPGAFTPTCSESHLPGFVEQADAFGARDIEIACVSVNDPFVMHAWGQSQHVPAGFHMLADGNADFTRAVGLAFDASAYGMGMRSQRYSLYAEDGVVKQLNVEAPGGFGVSSAAHLLSQLP